MRVETLPSPGLLSNGIRIRIEAAKAISAVEINAGITANGGISGAAKPLYDFFIACADAIRDFRDVTVPLLSSLSVPASDPSTIILAYSEGLDSGKVPVPADFAVTVQARTVTKVVIDGPFVFLSLSAPLVAGAVSVAYTQNTSEDLRLQDSSKNQAASFADTAVINGVV